MIGASLASSAGAVLAERRPAEHGVAVEDDRGRRLQVEPRASSWTRPTPMPAHVMVPDGLAREPVAPGLARRVAQLAQRRATEHECRRAHPVERRLVRLEIADEDGPEWVPGRERAADEEVHHLTDRDRLRGTALQRRPDEQRRPATGMRIEIDRQLGDRRGARLGDRGEHVGERVEGRLGDGAILRAGRSELRPVGRNFAPVGRNFAPVGRNFAPVARNFAPVGRNFAPVGEVATSSPSDLIRSVGMRVDRHRRGTGPRVAVLAVNAAVTLVGRSLNSVTKTSIELLVSPGTRFSKPVTYATRWARPAATTPAPSAPPGLSSLVVPWVHRRRRSHSPSARRSVARSVGQDRSCRRAPGRGSRS